MSATMEHVEGEARQDDCAPAPRRTTRPRHLAAALMRSALGHPWVGAVLVAALALGVRLWLLLRGVPPLDSDEAVVGLMAQHFLRGQHPVFFWGQSYMGSLEPALISLLFAVLPTTRVTLRLVPVAVSAIAVAQVYLLGRRLATRRAALWAATYLALGSPVYVLWMMRARGGYPEMIVLGQAALLLALRGPRRGWRGAMDLTLLGLCAGLGLWTDPLVVSYLAAALLVFRLQRRIHLDRRAWRALPLAGGVLLGASPLYWPSARPVGGLVVALVRMSAMSATVGANRTMAPGPWLLLQIGRPVSTALVSIPLMVGGWLGGVRSAGSTIPAFWAQVGQHPALYATGLLIGLLAALGVAGGSVRALRSIRKRASSEDVPPPHEQASLALGAVATSSIALFQVHSGLLFADPRYLLPIMSAAPLAAAWWASVCRGLAFRLVVPSNAATQSGSWRRNRTRAAERIRRILLVGGGSALLLWNGLALAALTPASTAALWSGVPVRDDAPSTIAAIERTGVRCAAVGDYWLGYRLAFESDERIIPIITYWGKPDLASHYASYLRRPACSRHMADVLLAGTPAARAHRAFWQAGYYPGYRRIRTGQYALYLPPAQPQPPLPLGVVCQPH